ncbi:unnamed protein product [Vitrella brassicaformis CCMP3155]|uniref:Uncharacterized protein n=2 Tax=Vitrella brassicaformis TaxID=1169539 RepID=A0A0G4EQP8_VITBC|nr:unnamed protein product [Vitrella brassicaformis CCMP3155]|eukprot:CEM00553.1 unnamed protein product [Vitrella brassicaformis CCMP3155]
MDDITEPDAPRLKDLHQLDKQRVGQLIKRLSEERRQRQSAETQVSSLRAKHSQVIAEASSLRDKFQQSLELLKTYQSRLDTSKKHPDESAAMGSSAPAPSRVHACPLHSSVGRPAAHPAAALSLSERADASASRVPHVTHHPAVSRPLPPPPPPPPIRDPMHRETWAGQPVGCEGREDMRGGGLLPEARPPAVPVLAGRSGVVERGRPSASAARETNDMLRAGHVHPVVPPADPPAPQASVPLSSRRHTRHSPLSLRQILTQTNNHKPPSIYKTDQARPPPPAPVPFGTLNAAANDQQQQQQQEGMTSFRGMRAPSLDSLPLGYSATNCGGGYGTVREEEQQESPLLVRHHHQRGIISSIGREGEGLVGVESPIIGEGPFDQRLYRLLDSLDDIEETLHEERRAGGSAQDHPPLLQTTDSHRGVPMARGRGKPQAKAKVRTNRPPSRERSHAHPLPRSARQHSAGAPGRPTRREPSSSRQRGVTGKAALPTQPQHRKVGTTSVRHEQMGMRKPKEHHPATIHHSHTHTHTYPSLTADDPCAWVGRDRSTNERALLQDADEVIQLLSSSERPAAGPSRALEDIPGPLRYLQQPETPPRRPSDRSGAGARDFAAFTFGGPPVLQ